LPVESSPVSHVAKVVLIGFGGPDHPSEVRPFIERILAGHRIPSDRIDEVATHYARIGGSSPYNREASMLRAALEATLARFGHPTTVLLGMRHSRPWLADVLAGEIASGIRRLIAVPLTPYGGADAGDRYRHALESGLGSQGGPTRAAPPVARATVPHVTWVHPFHDLPGFIKAWVARIEEARSRPSARPGDTWLLFTAHSVPARRAEPYRSQVLLAAGLFVRGLRWPEGRWSLAWQSRSGRLEDPWLEPDVRSEIRKISRVGAGATVVAPIGFLCDHVEVLYDLGVEAREAATAEGLRFSLARTVGNHPLFVEALAERIVDALS